MNKYRVTLAQTKVIVVEVEHKNRADAMQAARTKATTEKLFDKRIGAILAADVKEIDDD